MRQVVISRRARSDLREIGEYIAADNPTRAVSFVAELRARCQSLSKNPMQGRPASEIRPDARILVFRSYVILHRIQGDRVLVERIIHAARDRSAMVSDE